MATVTVELPAIVGAAGPRSPEDLARDVRLALAVDWYAQGRVSQELAAEIAGLNRAEFLSALADRRVDAIQVSRDDLREEVAHDLRARRERVAADSPVEGGPAGGTSGR